MNKNYLIIGGSSGIGKELVSILAKEGHNVFATYNENKVENNDNVQYQKFNVLNDSLNLDILPDEIDGLVYCPGSINLKPFKRFTDEDFTESTTQAKSGPIRQHLAAAAGQTPGSTNMQKAYDQSEDRNVFTKLEMLDTPYETPVFPEVDVIEPVPDLMSDSESDRSQSSADDHADLFETLQESLVSYRAAEKELLRRRNQYRDIQNEAAERQRQALKEKEVRKLLPVKEKEVHSLATRSKKGKEVEQASHRIPEPANSKLIHTGLSLHNLTHSSDAVTLAMARETDGLWIIPANGGQPVTGEHIRKRDIENRPACQVCDQMKMKMASSRQAHPVHQTAAYAVDGQPLDVVREKYGPPVGPGRSHHFLSKMVANGNLSSAKPVVARQSRRGRRSKPVRTCPGQVEHLLGELASLLKPTASRKDGSSRRRHLSH